MRDCAVVGFEDICVNAGVYGFACDCMCVFEDMYLTLFVD